MAQVLGLLVYTCGFAKNCTTSFVFYCVLNVVSDLKIHIFWYFAWFYPTAKRLDITTVEESASFEARVLSVVSWWHTTRESHDGLWIHHTRRGWQHRGIHLRQKFSARGVRVTLFSWFCCFFFNFLVAKFQLFCNVSLFLAFSAYFWHFHPISSCLSFPDLKMKVMK